MNSKDQVSIETVNAACHTVIFDMVNATAKWAACGSECDARKFAFTMAGASEAIQRMMDILHMPLDVEVESDALQE